MQTRRALVIGGLSLIIAMLAAGSVAMSAMANRHERSEEVVAASQAGPPSMQEATNGVAGGPSLSVLQRGRTPKDGLPEDIDVGGFANVFANPADVRLALAADEMQIYVGRGRQESSVCIVEIYPSASGVNCVDLAALESSQAATSWTLIRTSDSPESPANYIITGIVTDDVRSVRVGGRNATTGENVFAVKSSSLDVMIDLVTANGTTSMSPPPLAQSQDGSDEDGVALIPE